MKKIKILAIVWILLLMMDCSSKDVDIDKTIIRPIKYSQVKETSGEFLKTFNGTSQSGAETKLSFRTNGLITEINTKVGKKVKKGQLLAQMDLSEIYLNNQRANAALLSAKSQLETAQSGFERIKELYQLNSASLSDYEQAKNAYLAAKSAYHGAQKSMELHKKQFEYAQIKAPDDGVISGVYAEINELVSAGYPVFTINSNEDEIEAIIGVTENYISEIKNGDKAKIAFTGIPNNIFEGIVTEVGFASAQLATSPVVLKILDTTEKMRPGMPVEVTFKFSKNQAQSYLSVPITSVANDQDGTFVFVLIPDKKGIYKVAKTKVSTGKLTNNGFEILSGLNREDLVATAGLRSLSDGMKVKLIK